ncbi:Reverse transcriptase (RNA-dependent DNA polymerase) [Fragilaria crotonensis]|nr:Reverse transcriptase (RNA-dependent DNA polymerase) [Fragilaria crotonensis]
MIDFIEGMMHELPVDTDSTVTTPALSHLFDVNDDAEKLSDSMGEMFRHNTTKLLFLCKHARPDIQPAVAFLCTRVTVPDVDDYKKLRRTLEADEVNIVKWWVHPLLCTLI